MKVSELIKILGQFDGDKRIVIQASRLLLMPTNIRPLTKDEHFDTGTDVDFGDVIIQAVSEYGR